MARKSIKNLKWEHSYVAVFKCSRGEDATKKSISQLIVADGTEINDNVNLERVLNRLRRDLINRRVYRNAEKPTSRFLTFRSYQDDTSNEGRERLRALLNAHNIAEVQEQALALAQRYIEIPRVQEGVLIFLLTNGKLDDEVAENCIFVFKCDFETVSQITPDELFRQVEDAIVEQTKKGAFYPYFDWGKFDDTTVRVYDELGETQYWLDFLELGERKPEFVSLQQATLEQLGDEQPKVATKYETNFESVPKVRALTGNERLVDREDLYTPSDIKAFIKTTSNRIGDKNVTLRLGEVRLTAPLSQYGQTWIIAEEGDQRYFLVKGSALEMRTGELTPIDLVEFSSLREAMTEIDIPI